MATYEARRLENIKRNQALIDELGISRSDKLQSTTKRPPTKKRKLSPTQIRPTRTSARIASAPAKPIYNEADASPNPTFSRKAPQKKQKIAQSKLKEEDEDTKDQTASPPADLESIRKSWTSWTPVAEPPWRDETSTFHFPSHPSFQPNKSPAELLAEGVFGGSYYRPLYSKALRTVIEDDWRELPQEWTGNVNVERYLTNTEYDPEINKYKVRCGQSIEEWEANGWIAHDYDVRGWFQWYTRFWMGRRCEDDERQVGRWARCVGEKGRWRRTLLKRYMQAGVRDVANEGGEEEEVSPVLHQTCLHWAWEIRQNDLDEVWDGR